MRDLREIAKDMAEGRAIEALEFEAMKEYVEDVSADPTDRLGLLHPYVMTEWPNVHGHMWEWYEAILTELDDGDPRIAEFYGEFGVEPESKDGMCKCHRRYLGLE